MSQAIASKYPAELNAASRRLLKPLAAAEIVGTVGLSVLAGLPAWVAIAGWLSYYTRGTSLRDGMYNLACLVTGLGLGIVAQAAAVQWHPGLGFLAIPAALLFAAGSVWLMNVITGVHNIPSYFIGVLIVFVAGMGTSLDTYLVLTAAVSVGAFAAALPDYIRQVRQPEVES